MVAGCLGFDAGCLSWFRMSRRLAGAGSDRPELGLVAAEELDGTEDALRWDQLVHPDQLGKW